MFRQYQILNNLSHILLALVFLLLCAWIPSVQADGGSLDYLYEAAKRGDLKEALSVIGDPDIKYNFTEGSDIGGGTALMYAARGGNIKIMELLLNNGAKANARPSSEFSLMSLRMEEREVSGGPNKDFGTALMVAAGSGELEMVKMLLVHGADVNRALEKEGENPLDRAVKYGHLDIVRLLLAKGAKFKGALIGAADKGHLEIVKYLIIKGADVNTKVSYSTPIEAAASGGHLEVVKYLLAKKANAAGPGLISAARKGHLKVVKYLYSRGARSDFIMFAAARGGKLDVIKYLIAKGIDPKMRTKNGHSTLMSAAGDGHLEAVKFLIAKGVDVKAQRKDGYTALMGAASEGLPEIVNLLIAKGADVKVMMKDGESALSMAKNALSLQNPPPGFEPVLKKGADPVKVISILKSAGARK